MQFSNKQVYKFSFQVLWHTFIAYLSSIKISGPRFFIRSYLDKCIPRESIFLSSGTDAQHPAPDKFILIYY